MLREPLVAALGAGVWPALYRRTGVGPGAWLVAAVVTVGGTALSYAVGSPQPFCEGVIPYRGCLTPYGWAAAIYLGSSLGVAIAVGHAGRYRRLRTASVGPASEAEAGLVAVEGRIEPVTSAVTAPVSGADVAWYRTVTESPGLFGIRREVASERADRQFAVRDGSGRLVVLPDGLDDHEVAELARSATAETETGRRREWSYRRDDAVTVVGRASAVSRAKYPESVVAGLDGLVTVGERSLDELRSWAARRAVVGGALALLVGGSALLVMLVTA